MKKTFIFTSESVSEGHPDKVCDQISDAILDAYLAQDSEAHVACETSVTTNFVLIAGEVRAKAGVKVDCEAIARKVIADIGYTDPALHFSDKEAKITVLLHQQSTDIAQGVDESSDLSGEQGAGDQGMMFGFACTDTDELMPAPLYFSHKIMARFAQLRHEEPAKYSFLRPDAKAQLSFLYEDGKPVCIQDVVVSHQHTEEMQRETLEQLARQVVSDVVPAKFITSATKFHINPTGRFVTGGPDGDAGLTGRKIIVDTYGGMARHGGGAFSGKDPSKVDRSAAYMSRYAAKNLVAAGAADICEIQVSYAIGQALPISILVDTKGTGKVPEEKLVELLKSGTIFDFRPGKLVQALRLKTPAGWNYRQTAAYGHFGKPQFPWEKLDKVEAIKKALAL